MFCYVWQLFLASRVALSYSLRLVSGTLVLDRRTMGAGAPADLAHQVRDALPYLYDFAYLQRHPLAKLLVSPSATFTRIRGQELRRILLDAIEALNPGDRVAMRSPERRAYAILFGLYVEGHSQAEVAHALGIGDRQLRRDRLVAFEALTNILRDRYLLPAASDKLQSWQELLRGETDRLAGRREPLDLHELVDGLLPLLRELANERGMQLSTYVSPELPKPVANRTLARQILIRLASQALTSLPLARLCFECRSRGLAIGIGLVMDCQPEAFPMDGCTTSRGLVLDVAAASPLADSLGGHLTQECITATELKVWLWLPIQEETNVLVVDDNQEIHALFERYVVGYPYRMLHATSAEQALTIARSQKPDIVIVDLMMPERDGWELLQTLRTDSTCALIPTIVCSVLEEPGLALSLGVQGYLKKPVSQADLLRALEAARKQV